MRALGIQPAFAQKPLTKDVPPSDGSTDGGPACWDTCPADPTHDGVTNIDDLLAIINAWGVFGGYTDVNHDGVTNIDDLLAVINAWGPCHPPSNDSCATPAILNLNGDIQFCTRYATTDGPSEGSCGFCCGDLQIHKDVWYTFSTSVFAANYMTEIGLCGSQFDTKIAVYRFPGVNGCTCPVTSANLITCNDDTGAWCNTSSRK